MPPAPYPNAKQVSQEEAVELERTAAGEGDTSERRIVGRGRREEKRTTDGYGEFFCVPPPSPSIALTTRCSPPLTVRQAGRVEAGDRRMNGASQGGEERARRGEGNERKTDTIMVSFYVTPPRLRLLSRLVVSTPYDSRKYKGYRRASVGESAEEALRDLPEIGGRGRANNERPG